MFDHYDMYNRDDIHEIYDAIDRVCERFLSR